MSKILVAVSGGIDSVVLLDKLVRADGRELIVAHFDHGIREDSAADARFVEGLASQYRLPFVFRREELGAQASEETARKRRYEFLRSQAKEHSATIATAHHQDDVVESVAINLARGTGWRGLAVLGAADIMRPLLPFSKLQLREYALAHRLEWVEDSTNASAKYLRNRLRRAISLHVSDTQKQAIIARWQHQLELKNDISKELKTQITKLPSGPVIQPTPHELKDFVGTPLSAPNFLASLQKPRCCPAGCHPRQEFRDLSLCVNTGGQYSRYLLTMVDPMVAIELLRAVVAAKTGAAPTRPQMARALIAIKTARPGATFEIGEGVKLHFTSRTFIVADS